MNNAIKTLVRSSFAALDLDVSRRGTLSRKLVERDAQAHRDLTDDVQRLLAFPKEQLTQLLTYLPASKAQLRQDLFVLSQLDFKKDGFFVEFGAANGVFLSNTWLLEKEFGWTGILAEPARGWRQELKDNRTARIEERCVWSDSTSTLEFNETPDAEFSTINSYSESDLNSEARKGGARYDVKTISLNDMLEKHDAPGRMDYLSIDTEGSELEILRQFDFDRYSFRIITAEHNYGPSREQIFDLLSKHGYVRKHQDLSKWDDWYVKDAARHEPA